TAAPRTHRRAWHACRTSPRGVPSGRSSAPAPHSDHRGYVTPRPNLSSGGPARHGQDRVVLLSGKGGDQRWIRTVGVHHPQIALASRIPAVGAEQDVAVGRPGRDAVRCGAGGQLSKPGSVGTNDEDVTARDDAA